MIVIGSLTVGCSSTPIESFGEKPEFTTIKEINKLYSNQAGPYWYDFNLTEVELEEVTNASPYDKTATKGSSAVSSTTNLNLSANGVDPTKKTVVIINPISDKTSGIFLDYEKANINIGIHLESADATTVVMPKFWKIVYGKINTLLSPTAISRVNEFSFDNYVPEKEYSLDFNTISKDFGGSSSFVGTFKVAKKVLDLSSWDSWRSINYDLAVAFDRNFTNEFDTNTGLLQQLILNNFNFYGKILTSGEYALPNTKEFYKTPNGTMTNFSIEYLVNSVGNYEKKFFGVGDSITDNRRALISSTIYEPLEKESLSFYNTSNSLLFKDLEYKKVTKYIAVLEKALATDYNVVILEGDDPFSLASYVTLNAPVMTLVVSYRNALVNSNVEISYPGLNSYTAISLGKSSTEYLANEDFAKEVAKLFGKNPVKNTTMPVMLSLKGEPIINISLGSISDFSIDADGKAVETITDTNKESRSKIKKGIKALIDKLS